MARKLLYTAFIIATLFNAGCSLDINEGYEVDWAPVYLYIYATDVNNNSIIEPDMPGMTLEFKDETYTVQDWSEIGNKTSTRAYLARLYGLFAQPGPLYGAPDGTYRLVFGEIDGAADMDEDITLTWPDGSIDIIHYHCSNHKEGSNPTCDRSWKLNGKRHDGSEFGFIK